jgi:hypothetical protein
VRLGSVRPERVEPIAEPPSKALISPIQLASVCAAGVRGEHRGEIVGDTDRSMRCRVDNGLDDVGATSGRA